MGSRKLDYNYDRREDASKDIEGNGNLKNKKMIRRRINFVNLSINVLCAFCAKNKASRKTVAQQLSGHEHMLREAFWISIVLEVIIETLIKKRSVMYSKELGT